MKSEQQDRLNVLIDYVLVGLISLFSLVLIFNNDKPSNNVLIIKSLFVDVSSEIQNQVKNVDDYLELKYQNDSLRLEIERLSHDNLKYKNSYFELLELKKSLNFSFETENELLFSEVIAQQSTALIKQISIDRGQSDSVKINDIVLFKNNLVGKISFVTNSYSTVQLAIDPLFEASVRIQRTGQIATIAPHPSGYFSIKYVTKNADVIPGDVIVTSGLSSIYPKNIKIGVVQSVNSEVPGLFYDIKVKSYIEFDKLRYVSIIKRQYMNNLDSLIYKVTNEKTINP